MTKTSIGGVSIPIKLDNKPIQVKRKYGKHPARFIPGIVDIFNTKVELKGLIPKKKWKND